MIDHVWRGRQPLCHLFAPTQPNNLATDVMSGVIAARAVARAQGEPPRPSFAPSQGETLVSFMKPADPKAFTALFPNKTFALKHGFAGNPLLTLPRIVELVRELPRDRIEYNAGSAAISQNPEDDAAGRSRSGNASSSRSRPPAPGWCSSRSKRIRPIAPWSKTR